MGIVGSSDFPECLKMVERAGTSTRIEDREIRGVAAAAMSFITYAALAACAGRSGKIESVDYASGYFGILIFDF
jgi:hypothetical protein